MQKFIENSVRIPERQELFAGLLKGFEVGYGEQPPVFVKVELGLEILTILRGVLIDNSTGTTLIPGSRHMSLKLLISSQWSQSRLGTCVSVKVSSLAQSTLHKESFSISSRTNSTLAKSDTKKQENKIRRRKNQYSYTNQ